jgi:hypothetical protein
MTTAYATYQYYTGTFLGVNIASVDFARLALRASAIIDQITFQRTAAIITAATETAKIDLIKMATCAVAEQIQTNDTSPGGIQSESIGANSVTYVAGASSTQSHLKKLRDAAKTYLDSTGLLYPGFLEDEYGGSSIEDA